MRETKYYVYSRDRDGVRYYYPNPNYPLAECLRKGYFHSAVTLAEQDMFNSQFEAARFKQQCHLTFCFVGSTDESVERAENEILRDDGPTPEILEQAA